MKTAAQQVQAASELLSGSVPFIKPDPLCRLAGLRYDTIRKRQPSEEEAARLLYCLRNALWNYSGAYELNQRLGQALDDSAEQRGEPTE